MVAFCFLVCYILKGDNMFCENIFCVYQRNGQCVLNEIALDITGSCAHCIYVDIGQKKLEETKETQLRKIENP